MQQARSAAFWITDLAPGDRQIQLFLNKSQAIARQRDDTVYGMVEFAGFICSDTEAQLPVWLESIRQTRVAGLFDGETATYLMFRLVQMTFEEKGWLEDPEINRLVEEAHDVVRKPGEVRAAHGAGGDAAQGGVGGKQAEAGCRGRLKGPTLQGRQS
jgi:hypothetical protein